VSAGESKPISWVPGWPPARFEDSLIARGSVFLRGVVDFPSPRAIFGLAGKQARRFRHQSEKGVHADGIVWTPYRADAVPFDGTFDGVHLLHPAGGADHQVDAQRGDALRVARHGRRN